MKHFANSFILINPFRKKRMKAHLHYFDHYFKRRVFTNKMIISYFFVDICKKRWKYCRIPSRLNPMEFIRRPKSGRENYDRLECNWRGGPTLPLNALSAVFWCRVGPTWKHGEKKGPSGKEREWERRRRGGISVCSERRGNRAGGGRGEGGIEPERKKYVVKPD